MNTNNISIYLDVALSLTFFYFVCSMFVSGIVEFIHTIFEKRAAFLQKAFEKLNSTINDKSESLWSKLKENPFITNLEDEVDKKWKLWGRKMSYLDSSTFVSAIINILENVKLDENTTIQDEFGKIKLQIEGFDAGTFQQILKTLAQESDSLKTFEVKLANWFDQYMEHVSGWFKRYSRLTVMITSVVVTITLNLNTIVITKQLSGDKTLRNSIVQQAVNYVDSTAVDLVETNAFYRNDANFRLFLKENYTYLSNKIDTALLQPSNLTKQLTAIDSLAYSEATAKYLESNIQSLGLKIGYTFSGINIWKKFQQVFMQNNMTVIWTLCGWLLTIAALSFGAPFWFDLLVKLVNVRNVMKKPNSN